MHLICVTILAKGMKKMIVVTSAAGHTGSIIVDALVKRGLPVIATDLNPTVKQLPGIERAIVGDLTQLDVQLEIISAADILIYIPPLFSPEEALIGNSLIDLAAEAKLQQFIFMSVTHPILSSLLQHTAKRDVEEHLIYTGMRTQLPYTILQPMHYMHNFDPLAVKRSGKYRIFYSLDGAVAYVDPLDVAEVVLNVLAEPAKHNKATYELVGTAPYTPKELVTRFNAVTGEHAVAEYVPVEQFLDDIGAQDLYFRTGFKHLADSYSQWGLDGNVTVLTMLLGRDPTTFEDYLVRALAK